MAVKRQRLIQTAEKLVRKGRLEAAIGEYRKLLAETPDDTGTLNRVGDLYLRLGRMDEAIDLFSRTASHFCKEGFFVKAIAIYKKIIRVDPTRIQIYEELADLYHRQGLITEARAQYQVVADYYAQHDQVDAAISVHHKMIHLEPDDPSYRLKLAELFRQQGRGGEALEQLQEIASFMLDRDRIEEATRVYLKALEIEPENIGFLSDAALRLKERGDPEAAHRLVERALELSPEPEKVRELAALIEAEEEPAVEEPAAEELAVEEVAVEEPAAEEPAVEEAIVGELDLGEAADLAELEQPAGVAAEAADEAAPPEEVSDLIILDLEPSQSAVPEPAEAVPEPLDALEFEIGLDELEKPPPPAAELTPEAAGVAEEEVETVEPGVELEEPVVEAIDLTVEMLEAEASELRAEAEEFLRRADSELSVEAERTAELAERALELTAEAQVLAAYGLDEKAAERFEQVLEIEPENLDIYRRLIELHLGSPQPDRVIAVYERARAAVTEVNGDSWGKIHDLLEQEGYRIEESTVLPPAAAEIEEAVEPPLELEEPVEPLVEEEPVLQLAEVEEAVEPPLEVEEPVEPLVEEEPVLQLTDVEEVVEPPLELEEPVLPELTGDSAAIEPAATAETAAGGVEEVGPAEESAITWLEDIGTGRPARAAEEAEMFGQEEEFFDLAAELEEELRREEERLGEEMAAPMEEQSLEEIVEGFKKGVAQTLSPEDYDTHYNLGIAYREMGLLDEAIGEFQLAAKDPRYLVDCCSLLGASFLEKGFGDLALKWYGRGLESPEITEDETLGLMYELGNVHLAMGNHEEALKTFVEIYGVNSNFRDVVAKLEELRGGRS